MSTRQLNTTVLYANGASGLSAVSPHLGALSSVPSTTCANHLNYGPHSFPPTNPATCVA
jgi:hypothetical protein